ncbi:MAG TPA: PLP-dependent aminotransferase family protein [Acetobacteraceae bacterium]|nr:PLP-dependent aminotransferase family protein [Acetobacteraceae bacterium]
METLLIPLKLVRDQPLQQQLYDQLRELIATARLQPGTRMPSTRMLAEQFSISRITALLTYERLIAEGYLQTLPAKGTFVARGPIAPTPDCPTASAPAALSGKPDPSASVTIGQPDPALFPAGRWRALTRGALDRFGARLACEHASGHPRLRAAIAGWLSTSRGLAVAPDQIILVNGRQQALHLVTHLLLRPGARAVVEDPCDPRAAAAFTSVGATLARISVDADGLCTGLLPPGRSALVHVTPEHQRPLGVALTAKRRAALLEWAGRAGAVVVEEDCEGELRYHGMDVPPLMAMDRSEHVILVGGFHCSLGPWLSLGFMAVPLRLIPAALAARRLTDDSTRWLEETALAEFLMSGGYARHLHRLGKAYASRRDALVAALRQNFGESTPIWGSGAGLHLSWGPPGCVGPLGGLARLARQCGLEAASPVTEGSRNAGPAGQALLLGFGSAPEMQIGSRVAQFAAALRDGRAGNAIGAD